MALKRKSKPNAEFNMSSLTDIIFLLLIFFMLTSTLVQIEPFELPESNSQTVAPTSVIVQVRKNGKFLIDNKEVSNRRLGRELGIKKRENNSSDDFTITIVGEKGAPFGKIKGVIEHAGRLNARAILATSPPK